jgi:S1-C subfamily serine protease
MDVSELSAALARRFNFEGAYPILIVTNVERGGIADRAGLEAGDLILQINGVTVRNEREFALEMEEVSGGELVRLHILRISLGPLGQVDRRFLVQLRARTGRRA